ncbi:branched-chain amino acid transport system II carrier protein [Sneathia sanguinegens]|uniref:branched-chain amino acid transport system II carrier protein n=1 Tax=Sneathia sanguinegens TaxID=40543 RepID=UPI00082A6A6D|nr:branched-chain amino acid transport system II carrier protein [Sneathia sanguinegens]
MKDLKKTVILGFALFAMFFGAGNVFLPSYIGIKVGNNLLISIIGFLLTAVGLPLLGLLVVIKNKGEYMKVFAPLGSKIANIFLFISFMLIGPILAMPRLASTSYEMGILPIFPNANRLVVTALFFLIALILSINKSRVVERIGEYLTPLLILTLVILIFVGIISVKGDNETVIVARPFIFSFIEGYNTLDAIASVIFAKMIYDTVKNEENPMKISIRASLIAAICLAFVYSGLIYLGNRIVVESGKHLSRTTLILEITKKLLGIYGIYILTIIVLLACITTAIGLISSVSNYLAGRFSYKILAIVITAIAFIISQLEVDSIIALSAPILSIFYPVLIFLLFFSLLKRK